jgi:tetratricopeptide (TPR) repeat protein
MTGEFEKADQRLAKAISMYESMGNLRSLGMALGNLGSLQFDRGQFAQAETTMLRALQIHEEVGNTAFQPTTLGNLGAVRLKAGDVEGAEAYYQRAVDLAPHSRSPVARGGAILGHALCLAILGRRQQAISKWAEGSQVLQRCQADRELESRHKQMREECQKAGIEPLA